MLLYLINILSHVSHKRPICEVYLCDSVILSVILTISFNENFDKTYPDPNSNYKSEESNTSILVLSIWQYIV